MLMRRINDETGVKGRFFLPLKAKRGSLPPPVSFFMTSFDGHGEEFSFAT